MKKFGVLCLTTALLSSAIAADEQIAATPARQQAQAEGHAVGKSIVENILKAYEEKQSDSDVESARALRRRADDIANATIAQERDKVLDFLGIDPQSSDALYYFVSWSMPLALLRAYAIDAMWSGGTLVIKGVPPNKELVKFITEDLRQLVYGKGAAANISIDPRLFDAYAVKAVPTIVFTTVRDNMQCQGVNPVTFKMGEQTLSYDTCPELDPNSYWKLSGAVSTSHALDAFADAGASGVGPYKRALAKGLATGAVPSKEQKPFVGEWKDALSPSEQAALVDAYNASMPKRQAEQPHTN